MEALTKLRAKRTNIKGQITSFIRFVREHNQERTEQLPERIQRTEDLYNAYNEAQTLIAEIKLEALAARDPAPSQEELQMLDAELTRERQSVEDAYFEHWAIAKRLVRERQAVQVLPQPGQQVIDNTHNINVKLPTLQLPQFNGNYDQWLMYKDTFISVIHANTRLTNIQKFQYLRSSLFGDVLQVIHTLETTDDNYVVAWRLITERYENRKLIINKHIKELFELQPVSKSNHVSLRSFIDAVRTHVRALEVLKQPVTHWDTILIYLLIDKLDYATRKDWEFEVRKNAPDTMPTLETFMEYLADRAHTLELVEGTKSKTEQVKSMMQKNSTKKVTMAAVPKFKCVYCNDSHHISKCDRFKALSVSDKLAEVRKRQLCINCMRKGHFKQACMTSSCRLCSRKHNTMLHIDKEEALENRRAQGQTLKITEKGTSSSEMVPTKGPVQNCAVTDKETRITVHATNGPDSIVFIATAKVYICDEKGRSNVCRAMLDPGSQSNIITRNIVQKLGLRTTENIVPISGISHTRVTARESVKIKIKSMHNEFTAVENCLVMPTITVKLPQVKVDTQSWNIPSELSLADPSFQIPGEIDILLGSSIFWKILGTRQWELSNILPRLQETQLGWIVGGELVDTRAHSTTRVCNLVSNDLNHQLEKFWQLEEIQPRKAEHRYSAQDQATEEFFLQTVRRDTDGKYIV
ncbi:hypothetical protein ALC57_05586 [Trachymyrmex cornetzi]|uniref:Uncharacterized protein n=1 Tax=Trachymyrmex cornetzi TaxID=471704 RepID=A0A151JAJ1_9HYME|nr:hypothetical protein ALC57_05586 [Trachymyrmex cornetzi]